jgi:hypothetical protein
MKAQSMGPAAKPKLARRASARLNRRTTASEDDAEHALREIVATMGKGPGELESATRICEAKFGTLFLYDVSTFRAAAGACACRCYR